MPKNLGCVDDRRVILERLAALQRDSRGRWGRMPVHQMLCHLTDAFRLSLGDKTAVSVGGVLDKTLIKWFALNVPAPWPRGYPTRPEMEQGVGGTPPVEFERDRAELAAIIMRFSNSPDLLRGRPHPVFGPMSEGEWLRWGYLHSDHHLRQFDA
jgi:hypothetical protein